MGSYSNEVERRSTYLKRIELFVWYFTGAINNWPCEFAQFEYDRMSDVQGMKSNSPKSKNFLKCPLPSSSEPFQNMTKITQGYTYIYESIARVKYDD